MFCLLCASANQGEFGTEILVHFAGLKNLHKPPVWVFPPLAILAAGAPTIEGQTLEGSIVSYSGAGAKFERGGAS